ncbi:MAG: hypothetical protein JXR70_11600 [Spirochaetales bacterium]|nr:hypothetical protein [Spirochaetales bacterium]
MKKDSFFFILMIILFLTVPPQIFSGGLKACPIKANETVKKMISLDKTDKHFAANCPSNLFELLARNNEASQKEGFMPGSCCLQPAIIEAFVFESGLSEEPAWLISEQRVKKRPIFIKTCSLLI